MDPAAPAQKMSEPKTFIQDVAGRLGPFYTTGFQEDHKARSNGIFSDDEFARQAAIVLDERLALFDYAINNYDDGLLFFYFSSSDLQSHIFWWDSDEKHPIRSEPEAQGAVRPRPAPVPEARRRDRRPHGPLRQQGDDHRDERPRLRQLRQAVQPQFLAPRPGLPRPSRVCVDHARRRLVEHPGLRPGNQRALFESERARTRRDRRAGRTARGAADGAEGTPRSRHRLQRQAGHPRRLPLRPDLLRERDGPGAGPHRRLRPRLPRVVGDVSRAI